MSFYHSIIRPVLFKMPTETAHELGLSALKIGLGAEFLQKRLAGKFACDEFGELERFGLKFKTPFGVAAGFDKNALVANQLCALGFGFVEVGTVTFAPQKGNPPPRLFRLPRDKALINRAGFNNDGTPSVVERLQNARRPAGVLGVNIGKNKDVANEAATENYLASFEPAHAVAEYIAVNVSSPNTPNLRELQKRESLEELLSALQARNAELNRRHKKNLPLLVKIAPDLSEAEIEAVTDVCLRLDLAGIIATNTTVSRDNLQTSALEIEAIGSGGLSGKPLTARSTEVISKIYRYSKGKLPIIGVGGIFTAQDAFEKIAAGACLIQAYTGFIYQGLTFARDVNFGLAKILREKGFASLDEAIGTGSSPKSEVRS
jgi:dihydroorotate dehydrogenase